MFIKTEVDSASETRGVKQIAIDGIMHIMINEVKYYWSLVANNMEEREESTLLSTTLQNYSVGPHYNS